MDHLVGQVVGLVLETPDGPAVMGLGVVDEDALGQNLDEHGVQLDGPLAGPKFGQGEDRGTERAVGGADDLDLG